MKILILTLTYPPEPAEHIHDLAKHLAKGPHTVTVLTSIPSYPFGNTYTEYRNRFWAVEIQDNVRIVRLPVFPSHSKSLFSRSLYYISNAISITAYALLSGRNFDVALLYHPPLTIAIPGILLRILYRMPLICWVQDLWPETIEAQTGRTFITHQIERMANYVYRKSDRIIVISSGFKEHLRRKGADSKKIRVVHNWADPDLFFPLSASSDVFRSYNLDSADFHVFYAGNLGMMQHLETVVVAAGLLKDLGDLKIVFMGTGVRVNDLKEMVHKLELQDKVHFLGRVPQEEVNRCYALADAFIVHIKDLPLNRITIPHKIYGYMLASKPVVAAIRGEARDEIIAAGAGIGCNPQDAASIAAAIRELYQTPRRTREDMGRAGRDFVLRERTIGRLSESFEEVFREVTRGG